MNMKMCATPNSISCWEDINFTIAERTVKKLQKRIALAYENDNTDTVIYLQHKLIHSFYAKALAVKIVSTNKGKKTVGVDNVLWNTSEDKFKAIDSLRRRGYNPKPLKRIYIPKGNRKLRPLSIPTMKDRAMQTLYKFALEPIAEVTADDCSFGFRPNRNARDAIIRCCDILTKYPFFEWILKVDIKSCFDTISHEWIMEHIPMDKMILKKFLECGYIDKNVLYPNEEGVPQGGSISSIICNMTLDGLENVLAKEYGDDVKMVRYADDIMILGIDNALFVQSVIPVVEQFLSQRNLKISKEKTQIAHIKSGVSFLGWKIYKEEHRIIAVPTRKSIDSLLDKITDILNKGRYVSYQELYKSLKPIIRGWINYYNYLAPQQALYGVEFEVMLCICNTTGNNYYIAESARQLFYRCIQ